MIFFSFPGNAFLCRNPSIPDVGTVKSSGGILQNMKVGLKKSDGTSEEDRVSFSFPAVREC